MAVSSVLRLVILLDVLSQFGAASLASSKFENQKALELYEGLPEVQQNTPICAMAVAKCHFQAAEYKKVCW